MVYEFDGSGWRKADMDTMYGAFTARFGEATEGILRLMAGVWVGAGGRIYRMEW